MAAQTTQSSDLTNPWLRTYFLNRLNWLDRERSTYLSTWRDIAKQMAPQRGRFLAGNQDTSRGRRKDQRIIDNTPLLAARVMASGMMAGISSPARPWFRLRLATDALNKQSGARAWLDSVQQVLLKIFKDSNLYNCLHTLYGELGTFGTGALWVDEDQQDVVRGYTLTVGEYWLASSKRQAVDTLYRAFIWTVRQIVDEFSRDAVSAGIRSMYDAGQHDATYELVHAIEPNPNALPPGARLPAGSAIPWDGRLSNQLPWRSVWFERGQQGERLLLKVSGYDEFPIMAPRWDLAGTETYGSGSTPGWVTLGDAQQLQVEQRDKQKAIQKMHNPPMKGPPSLRNDPASLLPGGVTYTTEPGAFEAAIKVQMDISHLTADITEVQERIRAGFFADVFLSLLQTDRPQMTAEEVKVRYEEKLLLLGPVLERVHDELLDPLVQRVFNVAGRHGLIPPPPQGIDLAGLQVEFISVLAQAQKAVGTGAIERFWQFGLQIAAAKPEAADRLDADGTMDAYADMTGVPASVLVDLDKATAVREARTKATAQHNSLADAERLAAVGKDAAAIDVGGGANAVQLALGRG